MKNFLSVLFLLLVFVGVSQAEVIKIGNCSNCGKQNVKTLVVEDSPYCDTCLRQKCSPCWACSQWRLKEGGETLYVNMFVCSNCLNMDWHNQAFVNSLYVKVQQMMNRDLGLSMAVAPNLDVNSLKSGTLGAYYGRKGIYKMADGKIDISPSQKFLSLIGTVAHEYAHAIQVRKNPDIKKLVIIEGYATWVEYNFYKMIGQEKFFWQECMPPTRNDVYSEGLKLMRALEAKVGKKGVSEAVFTYREEE